MARLLSGPIGARLNLDNLASAYFIPSHARAGTDSRLLPGRTTFLLLCRRIAVI
ncbi:MAG: hypothetical protein ABSE70_10550 [Candidatus Limnocylindrales bacterium]